MFRVHRLQHRHHDHYFRGYIRVRPAFGRWDLNSLRAVIVGLSKLIQAERFSTGTRENVMINTADRVSDGVRHTSINGTDILIGNE